MSIPALIFNSSPASCGVVPTPGLVQFILPGLAFACAISSTIVWILDCAGTTKTFGDAPITMIGMKSLNGS